MNFIVKAGPRRITLCLPLTTTVKQVKEMLSAHEVVFTDDGQQFLVCGGRLLRDDNASIGSYGVSEGTTCFYGVKKKKKKKQEFKQQQQKKKKKLTFDTLAELFNGNLEISKRAAAKLRHNDFARVRIPVCQHNMYKYAPYHVTPVPSESSTAPKSYVISFPEHKLPLLKALAHNLADQKVCFTPVANSKRFQPKTPEDQVTSESGLFEFRWTPSPGFSLTQLMQQLYLSHANSFNFDRWYSRIAPLHITFPSATMSQSTSDNAKVSSEVCGPAVHPALLIPLTEAQVQLLSDLHVKTERGKYPGVATPDLLRLAKDLRQQHRGLDQYLQDKDGAPFFFKLSTRSAKDSVFYKERSVMAQIARDESAVLQRCQAK